MKVITIVTYFLIVRHWLSLEWWMDGSKMIEEKYICSKAEVGKLFLEKAR